MPKVYKLSAPNLVPYFSNEGRYLHAVIAVGVTKAGEKSFYQRLTDTISAENEKGDEKGDIGNEAEANSDMEIIEDEGANNLDIMLYLIEQQEKTQQRKKGVKELMHKFVADIDSHRTTGYTILGWLTDISSLQHILTQLIGQNQ